MKKIWMSLLLLSALLLLSGCAKIDTDLALGSVIGGKPMSEPNGGGGYEDSYGGGDSGGGIASFSGGSSCTGGESSISVSFLPDESKGKAVLVSSQSGISVFAGQKLSVPDQNLENMMDIAQNQLKTDKKFSKFSFLIVGTEQKLSDPAVKIKLNDTYKGKVAYVFFYDQKGNIRKINKNSDKDYISCALDDKQFVNQELMLNFEMQQGTFLVVFGAN